MRYNEYFNLIKDALESESLEMFIAENGYAANCEYSPMDYVKAMTLIYDTAHGNIKNIIDFVGAGQTGFANKYGLKLRTVQSWYANVSKTTDAMICLLGFAILSEIPKE